MPRVSSDDKDTGQVNEEVNRDETVTMRILLQI